MFHKLRKIARVAHGEIDGQIIGFLGVPPMQESLDHTSGVLVRNRAYPASGIEQAMTAPTMAGDTKPEKVNTRVLHLALLCF
ncbi:hypothetical protein DRQ12_10515 [candidate division KSB1 bacterium]|nr:MAG: hypothetical protein DRQ12_10515 [candidate division KSB1 bacterium]